MSETLKTPTIQEIEDSKARGEQSAFNKGPNGELLDEGYTMNDLGKVVWVGEGPEPDVKASEKTSSQPSANEKLFNKLVEDKLYSKDYEEFQQQFSSPSAKLNLYKKMKEDKLYSKSAGDFMNLFFPIKDEETPEVKEETPPADVPVEGNVTASSGEESSTESVPGFESFGKPARKVPTTEEVVGEIFNVKDSVTKTDKKVTSRAAEKYFDLSGLNRKQIGTERVGGIRDGFDKPIFENTEEEDLRAYFEDDKYEEYVKWDSGNGELPKENKKLNSTIEVEKANRQRELVEQNINNIPKEKRAEAILALPDIIGEEKEIVLDGITYQNPQDLYNKMIKRSPDKAMRFQSDYLAAANKGFNFDFSNYETNKATFEKDNKELFAQQAELTKKFDKLGDVTDDSPQGLKDQYNALVVENNNLNASLEEKGVMGLQDDLIKTRESLQARFDDLTSKAKTLSSSEMAATALGLDYSLGGRVALQMEKSFLAGGAVLGAGFMKILGEANRAPTAYRIEKDKELYAAIDNNYKSAINYYEEVSERIETTLPSTIKVEDINSGNVFQAAKQMLGNNSPSILVALGSGGVSAGLTMAGKRKAANIAAGLFFEMEAGGKIGDIEVTEKGAQANIDALNAMLIRDEKEGIIKTPDELLSIKSQISDNENALNFTGMQKAASTILYGGIASYAERLGTLSYVNGLNKTSQAIGGGLIKKSIRGAKGAIFNVAVELVEETATTLGHNLTDIVVLNEDKSMIEGLDEDFLVNTAFTSLAIQGPSMGMNSYNVLKSEALSKQEISDNQARTKELISIQARLKSGEKITTKERKALVDKKRELLKEAELSDVVTVQKLARMTPQEVTDLFESNRLRRKTLKELQELGAQGDSQSKFNKKQRQDLVDKYNEYDGKREFLLGKPAARDKKMMEALAKIQGVELGVDVDMGNEADMYYQLGKYQFNQDILKNIVGEKNIQIIEGLNSKDKLKVYLDQKVKENVISQEEADKALNSNQYAFNIGDDFVLMQDEIHGGIMQGGAAAMFAASSPLHELLHKDLRTVGIVVDDKIVKSSNEAVASIEQHLNDLVENKLIDSVNAKRIKKRIEQYKSEEGVDLEELITLVGDLKDQGVINRESMSINYDLKRLMKLAAGKFLGDKNMFLSFDTVDDVFRYIDSFQKQAKQQTLVIPPEEKEETKDVKQSKAVDKKSPEDLIKIIKRKSSSPAQVKAAEDALVPQYEALAVEALKYTEAKGDILRKNVVSAANEYYTAIVKNYDPKKGAFSTHVYNNIAPKNDTIFEKAKTLEKRDESISIDAPEARQVEGDAGVTTNTEKTFVQKINILQDFAIANRVADKIKALVKVVKGDNFKSIISKYAGKVGELIFGIPAKKIMDGEANLIPTTKYKDGMPIPAEAQSIQRVFNAPENADKFIKTLPLYNVTDKTADINKVGENLEVSRDTYGYAIGLKGLPLDYFYENYTDPKALSKDSKVYEQRVTSKAGRSMGLTSQTPVKRLKPQFRKPTPETVDQFKKDLGITPKNEVNVYSRGIGQLLKGVAKVHSINAAISGAQRVQEAKLKTAPVTEQKAIKQQTADITAAQSKISFSLNVLGQFNVEVKLDDLLQEKTGGKTYKLNTKTEIDNYVKALKKYVFPLMPKDFWFGKPSFISISEIRKELERFGDKFYEMYDLDINKVKPQLNKAIKSDKLLKKVIRANSIKTWGTEFTPGVRSSAKNYDVYQTYYKPEMQRLRNLPDTAFGEGIDGVEDYSRQAYSTIFKNAEIIEKNIKNGEIEKFNDKVGKIHKALWDRINSTVKKDKKSAAAIGNYLKLTASQSNHWHKLGAAFVGYSPVAAGKMKGKNLVSYEYEHAMPATAAYIFLLDAALNEDVNFDVTYQLVMDNYKLIALDSAENAKLGLAGLGTTMPKGWNLLFDNWYDRYFNVEVAKIDGGIDPKSILGLDGKTFEKAFDIKQVNFSKNINGTEILNKAAIQGRKTIKESKGITVLDFDDTLATSKSSVLWTAPDGTTGKLTAEEFAKQGADLLAQGYVYDFSEFNKVVKGKKAPLFEKALKLQSKFGPENMFILTARPAESAESIFEFVKANGLNIPLKNITGLANSTAEAKALWMADKVGEGYNDFYFADDALQNVQAVDNILEQFDVKRKVQQARIKFSESMNIDFNNILENVTGIESEKRFSQIKARKRGESKGKFRLFIPPSHEDFVGLLYNFMGKGKEGNKHRDFFEQALVRPLNRAYKEIDTAKQAIANDYKALNEQFPEIKDKLIKTTPNGDFTFQDAIRVYLWNKHGYKIPGLTPTDQASLVDLVMKDPELQAYAETLNIISKQDKYVDPGQNWETGNIRIDLVDATGRVGRKKYLAEFQENADVIFSEENLNKIEAAYGKGAREALEDMLHRIKTGVNRPKGSSAKPNMFMNWLNASVSGVMFFNTRSALLQQMSNVNYLNFADNNIYAAGKAFANQKQYWTDFAMIFNSDMMKQRRGGLGTDINGAELAEAIKKARPDNMFDQVAIIVGQALKAGFTLTQIGDNIAIATGGSAFYRNRVNKYIKDGMSVKEAETAAFTDFQDITQSTQQSARPDMTSQQQASWMGKLVLNFLNTPSQYNRIIKKAGSDIFNRRITPPNTTQMQSDMSNMSRILYYGAAQNLIFYTLQTALFAVMFGDDEDEEAYLKKKERVINGTIDTLLRGSGIYGVAISTLKNMTIKFMEQREKGYNKDESAVLMEALNFSPVVGIKARGIVNTEKTLNYNMPVIKEMELLDIDNPIWSATTNLIQSTTGAPANRVYQKTINLRNAADNQYTAFQRALFLSGYTTWSLNLGDTEKMEQIKKDVKVKTNIESKKKAKVKREEKKAVDLKEKEAEGVEKQKKEKKEGKQVTCLVCRLPIESGKKYCTVHEKTVQRKDGKKRQCRKYKENGSRCGMQTSNKSGFCYYHD